MNRLTCMILSAAFLEVAGISQESSFLSKEEITLNFLDIESCLMSSFQLDAEKAALIRSYLSPLIQEEKHHLVLDDFQQKCRNIRIDFSFAPRSKLSFDDGILKAAKFHEILFENPHIRILRSFVKCGEYVPPHLHQWRGLMIVIQEALFKSECFDGTIEHESCPIGVYELEPDKTPSSFTNIGETVFEALIFEIKD